MIKLSFPKNIADKALVASSRHCCICHKFCGRKIELHHIKHKADGGEDSFENCIPLYFDCHADMGKADPKHPKGKRFTEKELQQHRDRWYERAENTPMPMNHDSIHEVDKALFNDICSFFSDAILQLLSPESCLMGKHRAGIFLPLDDFVNNCKYKPSYRFLENEVEKLRVCLFNSIDKFTTYIALNTWIEKSTNGYAATKWWLTYQGYNPPPNGTSYEEWEERFKKDASKLNVLKEDVWNSYCEFVNQGRTRLFG